MDFMDKGLILARVNAIIEGVLKGAFCLEQNGELVNYRQERAQSIGLTWDEFLQYAKVLLAAVQASRAESALRGKLLDEPLRDQAAHKNQIVWEIISGSEEQ